MAGLANVPSITASNTTASYYDGGGTALGLVAAGGLTTATSPMIARALGGKVMDKTDDWERRVAMADAAMAMQNKQENIMATKLRIVKVIIADVDENIPLDKRVLYSGEEKITDATDQELFFEIDIKNILDKHNEYRVTLKDKSVKERVENLEPVKIRDLRMVVVNVATF
jgi:hypothetical protein